MCLCASVRVCECLSARDSVSFVTFCLRTLLCAPHVHQGIIHRDLKPENVLLVTKDSDTEVKLCGA